MCNNIDVYLDISYVITNYCGNICKILMLYIALDYKPLCRHVQPSINICNNLDTYKSTHQMVQLTIIVICNYINHNYCFGL